MFSKGITHFFEEMGDPRFITGKKLILTKQISSFSELVSVIVPKTVVSREAVIKPERFSRALASDLKILTLDELYRIAALYEVPAVELMLLIDRELHGKKKR